jgi:hypothetical protein
MAKPFGNGPQAKTTDWQIGCIDPLQELNATKERKIFMQNSHTLLLEKSYWEKGMTYAAYREMMGDLLSQNKTTGPNQDEAMVAYTRMNEQRMHRLDKTVQLSTEMLEVLGQISQPLHWLALTEAWCGDAAQNLPALAAMEAASSAIEMRLLLRDENLELMDQFLTAGGRSIPKLIAFDPQTMEVLGSWGPRPAAAQTLYLGLKAEKQPFEVASTRLHKWYADNKNVDLQNEMLFALKHWQARQIAAL